MGALVRHLANIIPHYRTSPSNQVSITARAMGAAAELPPPFSTIMATAMVGASIGAKAINRPW
jgi:hypothetical protein